MLVELYQFEEIVRKINKKDHKLPIEEATLLAVITIAERLEMLNDTIKKLPQSSTPLKDAIGQQCQP
jgi:hypothetical protein